MFSLDITVKVESFESSAEVWRKLEPVYEILQNSEFLNEYKNEKPLTFPELCREMEKDIENGFSYNFNNDSCSLFYANGGVRDSYQGRILLDGMISSADQADEYLALFLQDERFVQANLYDKEYAFWQSAEDISSYEYAGKSHADLTKRKRDLPPPLDVEKIDISSNPGRRVGGKNYVEFVSSFMWIGNAFWGLTGADKDALLSEESITCTLIGKAIKVEAHDEPFTQDVGIQREKQILLRRLLFAPE